MTKHARCQASPGTGAHGGKDPLRLVSGSEGAITGTVVCAAVIAFGVGHTDSTAELAVAIAATVGVYWLAHLHAVTIRNALTHGHHPVKDFEHALVETAPVAIVSVLPLAVLLVTSLAGASLSTSAWTALLVTIALLAAYSYMAGVRGGLGPVGRVASAMAGASIGVLVALLKVALH
jgi:hypothetical protein